MEKILVLDVETTNTIEDALIYDVGFIVADMGGRIYEKHSYTIADIFLADDLMEYAYFKEKMPQYWEDIKNGKRQLRRYATVRRILWDIIKQYDIKKIYAFNVKFDYTAFLTTQRYITSSKSRYYLPYGLEVHDIMKLAQELATTDEYKNFCMDNEYLTQYHKPQVKAEVVARYLFQNDFIESHTGLEDSEIEYKILCELNNRYNDIDTRLWGRD